MSVSGLIKSPATTNIISRSGEVLLKGLADTGKIVVPVVAGGAAVALTTSVAAPAIKAGLTDVGEGLALVGGNTQLAENIRRTAIQPAFTSTLPQTNDPSIQYTTIPTNTGGVVVVPVPTPATAESKQLQNGSGLGNLPILGIGVIGIAILGGLYLFRK